MLNRTLPRAAFLAVFAATFQAIFMMSPTAGQEWAKARLEKSPRHLEYVTVKHGDREVNCFIAYPEVAQKAPVDGVECSKPDQGKRLILGARASDPQTLVRVVSKPL